MFFISFLKKKIYIYIYIYTYIHKMLAHINDVLCYVMEYKWLTNELNYFLTCKPFWLVLQPLQTVTNLYIPIRIKIKNTDTFHVSERKNRINERSPPGTN